MPGNSAEARNVDGESPKTLGLHKPDVIALAICSYSLVGTYFQHDASQHSWCFDVELARVCLQTCSSCSSVPISTEHKFKFWWHQMELGSLSLVVCRGFRVFTFMYTHVEHTLLSAVMRCGHIGLEFQVTSVLQLLQSVAWTGGQILPRLSQKNGLRQRHFPRKASKLKKSHKLQDLQHSLATTECHQGLPFCSANSFPKGFELLQVYWLCSLVDLVARSTWAAWSDCDVLSCGLGICFGKWQESLRGVKMYQRFVCCRQHIFRSQAIASEVFTLMPTSLVTGSLSPVSGSMWMFIDVHCFTVC